MVSLNAEIFMDVVFEVKVVDLKVPKIKDVTESYMYLRMFLIGRMFQPLNYKD